MPRMQPIWIAFGGSLGAAERFLRRAGWLFFATPLFPFVTWWFAISWASQGAFPPSLEALRETGWTLHWLIGVVVLTAVEAIEQREPKKTVASAVRATVITLILAITLLLAWA